MAGSTPGHDALALIDQVLGERPKKNDHALSAATVCLAGFRDGLIAEWRANGIDASQRKQLAHVNAVITIVLGVHFPLGEVPWHELGNARAWLAEAVGIAEPAR